MTETTRRSEHTPGPWRVEATEDYGCKDIEASTNDPTRSRQRWFAIAGTHGLSDEAQDWANAHLIAAAPELYKSLADMLNLWHKGNPDRNAVDRLLKRAESALQKALGGES